MRRITYAPYTSGAIGALIGILVWAASQSVVLGIISFFVAGAITWFVVRMIENAIYKAGEKAADAFQKAYDSRFDKSHPHQMQSLEDRYAGITESGIQNNQGNIPETPVGPNQWRCPDCRRVNYRYVTTCVCGCSIEEAIIVEEQLALEEKKRKEEEAEKRRIEREKQIEKARIWEKSVSNYRKAGAKDNEILILKLLSEENVALSLSDMIRRMPRSVSVPDFKESVNHLEQIHWIDKDGDEKYHLTYYIEDEEISESGN